MTASAHQSSTFTLGDHPVNRLGYGAMQLAGSGVFGPPRDVNAAIAVSTGRTSQFRLFGRHSIPTRIIL